MKNQDRDITLFVLLFLAVGIFLIGLEVGWQVCHHECRESYERKAELCRNDYLYMKSNLVERARRKGYEL